MKNVFIGCALLVLLGAGCNSVEVTEPDVVVAETAPWFLTFEDGGTWQAYGEYWRPHVDFGVPAEASLKRGKTRVWLQNVMEPVNPDHVEMYKEDYAYYEGDDWKVVDVTVYPKPGGKVPNAGVEEVQFGDQTFWTRVADGRALYYWESEERVYEMTLTTAQGTDVGAEELFATIAEVAGVEPVE